METSKRPIRGLKEIMHPPITVSADAPAREALKILLANKIPGVPVEEGGKLVGFISDRHLLGSALPEYLLSLRSLSFVGEGADRWAPYFTEAADRPVREVMSQEVAQIELGKGVLAAAHLMLREGVSSVVITRDDRVVGIVNRLDLYAAIEGLDVGGEQAVAADREPETTPEAMHPELSRTRLDDVRKLELRYNRKKRDEAELAVVYVGGRVKVIRVDSRVVESLLDCLDEEASRIVS